MTLEEKANKYADEHAFRVPYDGSNKFYDDVDFKASKEGYLAGAKENQQAIEKAVEIIRKLGSTVREGVTCHYLVDNGALYEATLFLKEYAK